MRVKEQYLKNISCLSFGKTEAKIISLIAKLVVGKPADI